METQAQELQGNRNLKKHYKTTRPNKTSIEPFTQEQWGVHFFLVHMKHFPDRLSVRT